MKDVADALQTHGTDVEDMLLSNCTWERFGERMAQGGGRQLGLFDELTSFFSTMNMYSSQKNTVSDTKEYQELLSMFTGNARTRETITGNANFIMNQQSFTMMGFTQPHSALPIMKDAHNSTKGFTSRIIWIFPKPVFCTMAQRRLTEDERTEVKGFRDLLVEFLCCLYNLGNSTYKLHEQNKTKIVKVKRREFCIQENAQDGYDSIHDTWEEVCKHHKYDKYIPGMYSRGKGQVLRLSVPIQLLLHLYELWQTAQPSPSSQDEEPSSLADPFPRDEEPSSQANPPLQDKELSSQADHAEQRDVIYDEEDDDDDFQAEPQPKQMRFRNVIIPHVVSREALEIAKSIVDASIQQQCILNQKTLRSNHEPDASSQDPLKPLLKQIILTDSRIISFPLLTQRGIFRKPINGNNGKPLAQLCAAKLMDYSLGTIETYYTGNKTTVPFFVKDEPPSVEASEEVLGAFAVKLAQLTISLANYRNAFLNDGETFENHNKDYQSKKSNPGPSPSKRQRIN